MHTTASDGQLSPSELFRFARQRGLNVIAITDHDTVNGIAEIQQAATGSPVVIPGIELSAEENELDVHILGYHIRPDDAHFQSELERFQADRFRRGQQIVERLAEIGVRIRWEDVLAQAAGVVGRPHIAQAMLNAGYVETINEAFERYLRPGTPAYVPRSRLSPEAAIDLIHKAGGAAVLAHPALIPDYSQMIERLVPCGLDGVEVLHPKNIAVVRQNLRALAYRHDLIMTGGSDFHRRLDSIGSLNPPPTCVRDLRERAKRYQTAN